MTLRLKGSSSGFTEINAPAAAGSNTLILPTSNGSANQFLKNGGTAGTLEFASLSIAAGDLPTGTILQIQQTHVNTTSSQSITADTRAEVSGLSVNITPISSSSDMLVMCRWCGEPSTNNFGSVFGIRRDSTDIGNPAAAGSRNVGMANLMLGHASDNLSTMDGCSWSFLDTTRSSGTSQITYKATVINNSALTLYNQRTGADSDSADYERATSTIIVMEVAA